MSDEENPWHSDASSWATPPPGPPPSYGQQHYPPQPPMGYQAHGQPGFGPRAQSNSKATTSMVLGIVGLASILFCYGMLGIVLGPLSFFMGRSAQKEMELAPHAWTNHGMAKAGWIMGLIQTVIAILAIAAVVAFFIFLATAGESEF